MRASFIKTLIELAENDPRILLLTGDIGFMALEPFRDRFPGRFFNAGVSEQNMLGLATGLAEAGFLPFVYSIATFVTLRPYEFIRNGPLLHRLPVRIVGVGGGFEYAQSGITHHALEDVGVMRLQPGMRIIAPADYGQARAALLSTWDTPGPVYYRIGKDDTTLVPGLRGAFAPGEIQCLGTGKDLLIIAMGAVAVEAVAAAEALEERGTACTVAIVADVAPAPAEPLARVLSRFATAMTVEAHYLHGGLGSLVSEIVAERGLPCRVVRRGVAVPPDGISGSNRFLLGVHGLDRASLASAALTALAGGGKIS